MVLVVFAVLGFIPMKGAWLYLWREWLTSVDHKRIGVMYCILALVMLLRGFSDAILMRRSSRSQPAARKDIYRLNILIRYFRRTARS
jgi:hypothetical protein